MRKIISLLVLTFDLVLCFASCGHEHTWRGPTCTEGEYCSECGEYSGLGALGHDFGEWELTKEPTLTEDGTNERVCRGCGKKETEIVKIIDIMEKEGKSELEDYHDWLKRDLKNPSSYTVNSAYGSVFCDKETGNYYLMLSVDFSAQNSFGGYVRSDNNKNYFYWNVDANKWSEIWYDGSDEYWEKINGMRYNTFDSVGYVADSE